jgi:hypothetical protein
LFNKKKEDAEITDCLKIKDQGKRKETTLSAAEPPITPVLMCEMRNAPERSGTLNVAS